MSIVGPSEARCPVYGASVRRIARRLLRRHVGRRPHRGAERGERAAGRGPAVFIARTSGACGATALAIPKSVTTKDLDFVRVLLAEELVSAHKLLLRIGQPPKHKPASEKHRQAMHTWVKGIVKDLGRAS